MTTKITTILLLLLLNLNLIAQPNKKNTNAIRTNTPPKIDGILDDAAWKDVPILTDFVQYVPYNGKSASQKTEVKIVYDDDALYICALLLDSAPDSILTELGKRDGHNEMNADQFSIHIRPFNDGLNSFYFMVSVAGIQTDKKYYDKGMDLDWDSVWESETKITEEGWIAEMKIPYSAIRFPKKEIQNWGFNLFRYLKRNEEWASWSFVSREIDQWWSHIGSLNNIENIDPPTRLSFSPYVSGYAEKNTDTDLGYSYNGGMDVKYGINESFTVDMTLIPDFGQVQSDDHVLNLSPYEIQYNEKRQFFTEGTELYDKAGLFYSRRIGNKPIGYNNIIQGYGLNENEKLTDNPIENQLINATKISGKTKDGLGIGFFNGMTSQTNATVKDTLTGQTREVETQPFTNYNLIVLEQALENNSSVSLINTNIKRKDYMANVFGTELKFTNKNNSYEFRGTGAASFIDKEYSSNSSGFYYALEAGKTRGQFKYDYELSVLDNKYNPNDMGYLRRNNEIIHRIETEYNKYNPFSKFLDLYNEFSIQQTELHTPHKFSELRIDYEIMGTLKNYLEFNMHASWYPKERRDFFEARVPGKMFIRPKAFHNCGGFWTDRRKSFFMGLHGGFLKSYDSDPGLLTYWLQAEPNLRINDKLMFGYTYFMGEHFDEVSYVSKNEDNSNIYFGKMNWQVFENIIEGNYIFNNKASLDFRLRHYWSQAKYDKYYELKNDGSVSNTDYSVNHNKNYNAFTVDMVFTWNFAPGSEMLVVWKNSIDRDENELDKRYFRTLKNTLNAPQINSISLKVLYYLDYKKIKKKLS